MPTQVLEMGSAKNEIPSFLEMIQDKQLHPSIEGTMAIDSTMHTSLPSINSCIHVQFEKEINFICSKRFLRVKNV